VDVFRVHGGRQHDYIIGVQTQDIMTDGIALGPEEEGSLAGLENAWGEKQGPDGDIKDYPNKPYWNPPPGSGYGFFYDARAGTATSPFHVDCNIAGRNDAHLRIHCLPEPETTAIVQDDTPVDRDAVRRANKLALARDYFEVGEYQRALDLLDEILIEDAGDQEARELKREVLSGKRAAEAQDQEQLDAQQRLLEENLAQNDTETMALAAQQAESAARSREAEARAIEAEARRQEAELAIQQQLAQQRADEERRRVEDEQRREAARQAELERMSQEERAKTEQIQDLITEGRALLEAKDYVRARSRLESVLNIDLQDQRMENRLRGEVKAALAQSYMLEDPTSSRNRQNAIQLANQALQLDDSLWEAHYTLGEVYYQTERFPDAIAAFSAAARLNPDSAKVLYELARAQTGWEAGFFRRLKHFTRIRQIQCKWFFAKDMLSSFYCADSDLFVCVARCCYVNEINIVSFCHFFPISLIGFPAKFLSGGFDSLFIASAYSFHHRHCIRIKEHI